jgi:hypothetical protein
MNPNFSSTHAPLALLFLGMAIVIMWFSAKVVGVRRVTLFQCVIAAIGVSVLMGATMTALSAFALPGVIMLLVVALVGSVAILRAVFHIPTLPAFLIWVVNVMVQVLIMAMFTRMLISEAPVTPPGT